MAQATERPADVTEKGADRQLTALLITQLDAAERERTWLRALVDAERARLADKEQALAARDRQIALLNHRDAASGTACSAD